MHYACLVITKEFPTDEVLEKVLSPYNDDVFYSQPEESQKYPPILWDWWQVGGRYNGRFKLTVKKDDEKHRWEYYAKEPRAGRLFRSSLLEKMKSLADKAREDFMFTEEDCFWSMGYLDGFIYVDGGAVSEISNLEDVGCYCCIDADGIAIARSSWNGEHYEEDKHYDEKLKAVIANSKDYYACMIDLHD